MIDKMVSCRVERHNDALFYRVTVNAEDIAYGVDLIGVSKLASIRLQDIIKNDLEKEERDS